MCEAKSVTQRLLYWWLGPGTSSPGTLHKCRQPFWLGRFNSSFLFSQVGLSCCNSPGTVGSTLWLSFPHSLSLSFSLSLFLSRSLSLFFLFLSHCVSLSLAHAMIYSSKFAEGLGMDCESWSVGQGKFSATESLSLILRTVPLVCWFDLLMWLFLLRAVPSRIPNNK